MPIPAGAAFIDVKPSFKTFGRDLAKGTLATGRKSGAELGKTFGQAAAAGAIPSLRKLGAEVGKARDAEATAAGKVRVAETRLNEVRGDSKTKASVLARAEETLAKAQREHKSAQDKTTASTKEYTRAQERAADKTAEVDRKSQGLIRRLGKVDGAFARARSKASSFAKSGAGQFAGGLFAYASLDQAATFTKDAVGEARESQKVSAITAATIKSTGGSAKVTADQIDRLATSLSNKTAIDDEQIQAGANQLLTFKQVRNETGKLNNVFDRATKASLDLSKHGFGSIDSTSKTLGKALNDPTKGITALSRAGVTFSDQQKSQIKALQHGGLDNAFGAMGDKVSNADLERIAKKDFKGDIAKAVASLQQGWSKAKIAQFDYYAEGGHQVEAQKRILKEVESQVGGTAEASATAGEKASTSWANFKEQIGTSLLPALDKTQTWLTTKAIPAASGFIEEMQTGKGPGGEFASTLKSIGSALKSGWEIIAPYKKEIALAALAFGSWKVASGVVGGVTKEIRAARDAASSARSAFSKTKGGLSDFASGLKGADGSGGQASKLGGIFRSVGSKAKDAGKAALSSGRSALVAAKSFGTLALAQTKAGLAAAGAAIKTGALKVAQLASTAATKAMTVATRVLNVAMRMNPLGMVLTALTALGVGLVIAYKKSATFRRVVDGALSKVKTAGVKVFGWFRSTALPWMRGVFTQVGDKARWLYTKAIRPAMTAVGVVTRKVFGWIRTTGMPWVRTALGVIGTAGKFLWSKVIRPYFGFIFGMWRRVFGWIRNTGAPWVGKALSAIGSGAKTLWTKWISPYFSRIRSGAMKLVSVFRDVKDGIGKAWSGLTPAISGPVNKALQWLDRNFLSKVRSVLRAVGADGLADKIPTFLQRSTPGVARTVGGRSGDQQYAGGGRVRGYSPTPTADNIPAWLTADEYVLPVQATRKLVSQVGESGMEMLRRGRLPGYAIGGKVARLNPAFLKALSAFNAAAGGRFSVLSGFRTRAEQEALYQRYLAGGNLAARPGTSRHESGNAADLTPSSARDTHGALARKYGLHFPVPGEAWHVELINGAKGGAGGWLSGLAKKVYEKGRSVLSGLLDRAPGGVWMKAGVSAMRGAVGNIFDSFMSKAEEFAGDGSAPAGSFKGGSVERWRPMVLKALGLVGQPTSLANAVLRRMNQESGGNPRAINLWDSNAKAGTPSKGLMQVIDPTFRSYAMKGYSSNIYDPLSNILASMRYAKARYGSLAAAYNKAGGYARGTTHAQAGPAWVGENGPELLWFRGGERVSSTRDSAAIARGRTGGPVQITGRLRLDPDGTALIRGIAEDVFDDNFEHAGTVAGMH